MQARYESQQVQVLQAVALQQEATAEAVALKGEITALRATSAQDKARISVLQTWSAEMQARYESQQVQVLQAATLQQETTETAAMMKEELVALRNERHLTKYSNEKEIKTLKNASLNRYPGTAAMSSFDSRSRGSSSSSDKENIYI